MKKDNPPLTGLLAVEYGERLGATVCGSILAHLGADVVLIEHTGAKPIHKWANRNTAALGKRSLVMRDGNAEDTALLARLLNDSDVVLTSSDIATAPVYTSAAQQITCDITAFGVTGPLAGKPYSDALVQSLTGLADTTGDPTAPPSLVGIPFCEVSAGIYAAAAIMVALRVRRTQGLGQHIDMALYDCAISALSTFLPFHAVGKPVTRSGNRHSLAAPWNAYKGSDGWVLICTATDEQWRRLCTLIGEPALAQKEGFVTNAGRITKRAEVDAVISRWTATQTVADCIERLAAIDIACGPILPLAQLAQESNLVYRKMIRRATDAQGTTVTLPGSPLATSLPLAINHLRVPSPDEHREELKARAARTPTPTRSNASDSAPLAGMRVLEIGQYTTAPLVGRQLGMLGAQVFKIEPPGGEGSRTWPPVQGDRGYFFALSNNDKRSLELNLQDQLHRDVFVSLLKSADVLVENLKPGSLARLGFGAQAMHEINPRLVYCGISGFGAHSIFPGRPAFDTVVQAMSGLMDVTRSLDAPVKAGISAADIVGGEYGLLAILTALEMRDQTGSGMAIDISMQDAAVSATASLWNAGSRTTEVHFIRCVDGYVCVEQSADNKQSIDLSIIHDTDNPSSQPFCFAASVPLSREEKGFSFPLPPGQGNTCSEAEGLRVREFERTAHTVTSYGILNSIDSLRNNAVNKKRDEVLADAITAGFSAVPVCSVSEAATSAQTKARNLIIEKPGEDGRLWPLVNSAMRLSRTPPRIQAPIGDLGEANAEFGLAQQRP